MITHQRRRGVATTTTIVDSRTPLEAGHVYSTSVADAFDHRQLIAKIAGARMGFATIEQLAAADRETVRVQCGLDDNDMRELEQFLARNRRT